MTRCPAGSVISQFIEKNYSGFTVYIDCRNNGPIAYHMTLAADAGDEPSLNDFKIDNSVPANCQMTTGDTFKVTPSEKAQLGKFHRGHLADATPQPTTRLTGQPCLQKDLDLVPPKHAQECDGEQSDQ